MNSFYSIVYNKFTELQISQFDSTRFAYPADGSAPFLRTGKQISDCVVGIPQISLLRNSISYGPFTFEDNEFGQVNAVKLVIASISLLAAKAIFRWVYQDYILEWITKKPKSLRARHAVNVVLDLLARQRIKMIQGDAFYNDVIKTADRLSAALLNRSPGDYPVVAQTAIASFTLGAPVRLALPVMEIVGDYESCIKNILSVAPAVAGSITEKLGGDISAKISRKQSRWDELAKQCNMMYSITSEIPGKWHNLYLPYSNLLEKGHPDSIGVFQPGLVTEDDFKQARRLVKGARTADDSMWQEIFFEFVREIKFREKIKEKLLQATRNLNFSDVLFPNCDYVNFSRMQAELSADIRKISERVRMVKNTFDENTFQELGTIDLQLAIQAIASESRRNDIFTRDEELSKEESWTILIDSSKSLSGPGSELRAVAICLAETAHTILGSSPWGMFAFSDELMCIKDFAEKYDNLIKARIGGLKMSGLSHIPDAIRACSNLVKPYSKERNFMILVSDGLPSGYSRIEEEFSASVKELRRTGIHLIAMGLGSQSIKKTIKNARVVEKPTDIAKEFIEVYMNLSS
ncbi:MAG TPA: hypothetical protein VI338_06310 [Nitrososphaera sp.]|nr:hypothetical protein [Nitrososphaera sp.]